MIILLMLMVSAGLLGATVNMAVSSESQTWENWRWRAVAGIGAAFLVPVFLQTVSSQLLSKILGDNPKNEDLLVFLGFCVLAAISSKKFIEGLSEQLLRQNIKETEKIKSEMGQLSERTQQAGTVAQAAAEAVAYGTTGGKTSPQTKTAMTISPGVDPEDPWKGQFGGSSAAGSRKLEAKLSPLDGSGELMIVTLQVTSTDPNKPLNGAVRFFLHPTFGQNKPVVEVKDGKAVLSVISFGAFTVGATTDGDTVNLELDLSTLPEAAEPWRSR